MLLFTIYFPQCNPIVVLLGVVKDKVSAFSKLFQILWLQSNDKKLYYICGVAIFEKSMILSVVFWYSVVLDIISKENLLVFLNIKYSR